MQFVEFVVLLVLVWIFFFLNREVGRGRVRDKEVPGCKHVSLHPKQRDSKS